MAESIWECLTNLYSQAQQGKATQGATWEPAPRLIYLSVVTAKTPRSKIHELAGAGQTKSECLLSGRMSGWEKAQEAAKIILAKWGKHPIVWSFLVYVEQAMREQVS
jgi:hypothetical protein